MTELCALTSCACGTKKKGELVQLLEEKKEDKPAPPPSRCNFGVIFGVVAVVLAAAACVAVWYYMMNSGEKTGCTEVDTPCTVEDGVSNITLNGRQGWNRDEINAVGCYVCAIDPSKKEEELANLKHQSSCSALGIGQMLPCDLSVANPLTYVVCFLEEMDEVEYKTMNNKVCSGEEDVTLTIANTSSSEGFGEWGVTVVEDD